MGFNSGFKGLMYPEAHVPNKKILKYVRTSVLRSKRTSWKHTRKTY